ncbi:hypothetical protein [Nitratireductor aquibiodomus]|uniref:hypothetical protein n=1 Tax=Nitratireductor aquibiodomus TaxID=204799 RepID=UPI000B1744A5|nr:hypothetical protein [Nitratireductor aquibiodomus]
MALIRLPVEVERGKPNLVVVLPWRLGPAPRIALFNRVGLAAKWPPPPLRYGIEAEWRKRAEGVVPA